MLNLLPTPGKKVRELKSLYSANGPLTLAHQVEKDDMVHNLCFLVIAFGDLIMDVLST